jgi:type I restriction enzyme S subunit
VDKLTQSILAKAFRGELVPQDPNDEPASELLKRIQEERRKQEAESRPGRGDSRRKGKAISSTL